MRLIDADALAERLGITDMDCYKCAWGDHGFCGSDRDLTDACEAIEDAPTIDAVPVVHGEWKVDKKGYPHIICSLCDVHIPMVAGWCMDAHINYCPNCGAKMRGGADNGKTS